MFSKNSVQVSQNGMFVLFGKSFYILHPAVTGLPDVALEIVSVQDHH